MLLCLSRDQRVAYLLGITDTDGAEICGIGRAAFRQRLARARATMRQLIARRCGLIRTDNPCSCDRLVRASIDNQIMDGADLRWACHEGVKLPIATSTIEQAASELDLAVAIAEVYHTDPAFTTPRALWARLAAAMPTLLDPAPGVGTLE